MTEKGTPIRLDLRPANGCPLFNIFLRKKGDRFIFKRKRADVLLPK